jgi:hypothetical protein
METSKFTSALLPHLPAQHILARYDRAPGQELTSEKFTNPESSAALVANTFGFFADRPEGLPLPETWVAGEKAQQVLIEEEVRFPWPGGKHPWLDVVIETKTALIGIESKRYEPFRGTKTASFSDAYWKPVWGKRMGAFEWMRDGLDRNPVMFEYLDAVQLVKHAFGLRTRGQKAGRTALLVYLFAEPKAWPNGCSVTDQQRAAHLEEARCFARMVGGAELRFELCTYQQLLAHLTKSDSNEVRDHVRAIAAEFDV